MPFRSPGKTLETELEEPKAKVYQERYENFRNGVALFHKNIVEGSEDDLKGCTFVFVSVDKGEARKLIFEILLKLKIPFITISILLINTYIFMNFPIFMLTFIIRIINICIISTFF